MKHIVKFSGGAASAYVAKLVIDEFGRDDTILLFHDTKVEHPDAYRFRKQVSEFLQMPITEVSDGRDLWQVIADNHCLPSNRIPFCTRILKQEPNVKFNKTLEQQGISFITYVGLGMEEWRRVQNIMARAEQDGLVVVCPLAIKNISDKEVKRIIRDEWKICLPQPYKYLKHNNCIPCFKGGKSHFEKVCRYYPEAFEKAMFWEDNCGDVIFRDGGLSLRQLKQKWDRQSSFMEVEESSIPCMCAV